MKKKALGLLSSLICALVFSLCLSPSYGITDFNDPLFETSNINRDSWWWTDLELISEDSTDMSVNVDFDIDSNDNLHVCWRDNTDYNGSGVDQDIFYRKWNKNTDTWSTVEVVSTESTGNGNDPTIAVDLFGNVHIVWIDSTDYLGAGTDSDIFYKIKLASTGLWSATEIVSSSSLEYSYRPDIAVDSSGNSYVVWHDNHDFDGGDIDIIFKKRDLVSETWSAHTVISSESTDDSEIPKIVLDGNDFIHVIWQDDTSDLYGSGPDNDVFYKMWDPVNSWSSGLVLSYESPNRSTTPYISIDKTNSVHTAWSDATDYDGCGTDYDIFYRKWQSSTSTWTPLTVISTVSDGPSSNPRITIDNYLNVHFTWKDGANYGGAGTDTDAFYCYLDSDTGLYSLTTVISSLSSSSSNPGQIHSDSLDFVHIALYDYSDILGSGSDPDIFFKKFVGPPAAPILASFVPISRTVGNLKLEWSPSVRADKYSIFRSNSYIWNIEGLTPIATTENNTFTDDLIETGIYYYAVVASSKYGESELSNVQSVEIIDAGGFFGNLNSGELLIFAGIVIASQIVISALTYLLLSNKIQFTSKTKKGKKS